MATATKSKSNASTAYKGPAKPKTVQESRDVLEDIRKRYDKVPDVLQQFSQDEVDSYCEAMNFLADARKLDIAFMKTFDVMTCADADEYSAQHYNNPRDSQLEFLEGRWWSDFYQHSLKYTRQNMIGAIDSKLWHVKQAAEADIENEHQVKNLFGRPERVKMVEDSTREALELIDVGLAFDEMMGETSPLPETKKQVLAWQKDFAKKVKKAADAIVPPQDIGDPALTKIAEDFFKTTKAKLPKHERMIVNSPRRREKRNTYTVHGNWMETTTRDIESFQVTTIEKKGSGFVLVYNELLYYHEGPSTVPVKTWVLGNRHEGTPIIKENIDK